MNCHQLNEALKQYGIFHMFTSTGGIYTATGRHFIGAVSMEGKVRSGADIKVIRFPASSKWYKEHIQILRTLALINNITIVEGERYE